MASQGESHVRTIYKTLSWRVCATVITMVVTYLFTHEMDKAFLIGGVDTVIKLFAYYGHERAWLKVGVGKAPQPEYEI